jgi:hypothetical protein
MVTPGDYYLVQNTEKERKSKIPPTRELPPHGKGKISVKHNFNVNGNPKPSFAYGR